MTSTDELIRELSALAVELGASGARSLDTSEIVLRDELAAMCVEPPCPNLGLGAGCPPHVEGPSGFRELLGERPLALVFKLEVPTESLLGEARREIFVLLQQIAATLERAAIDRGFRASRAYAGGSCRNLFCAAEPDCAVLSGRPCRHPEEGRPSMSGFGVDVSALMASVGWPLPRVTQATDPGEVPLSPVVGLVLIGRGSAS